MTILQNNRDAYWDTVKAALIFLVVLGHTIQQFSEPAHFWHQSIFKAIYLFHMPLFAFISGYFALDRMRVKTRGYIRQQASHLLLPAITVGFIELAINLSTCIVKGSEVTLLKMFETCITLWFLWVIFECCAIGWLLWRFPSRLWRIGCATLPMMFAVALAPYFPYSNYFTFLWPFFLLGCWFKYRGLTSCSFAHPAWWLCLPLAVVAFMFWQSPTWYVYKSPLTLATASWLPAAARLGAGVVCSIAFLSCMHLISPILTKLQMTLCIGRCTLGLYVLQHLFFVLFGCFLPNVPLSAPLHILIAAAICLLCYFVYQFLSISPRLSRFLFGKLQPKPLPPECGTPSGKLDA